MYPYYKKSDKERMKVKDLREDNKDRVRNVKNIVST